MSENTKKDKKGKKKRDSVKYPNIKVNVNLRTRYEEAEDVQSYFHTLDDKAKEYMNKFMGEWNNASLDVRNLDNNLHNTKELKKSCQDRNNARNRCVYSRAKASGNLTQLSFNNSQKNSDLLNESIEDFNCNVNENGDGSESGENL